MLLNKNAMKVYHDVLKVYFGESVAGKHLGAAAAYGGGSVIDGCKSMETQAKNHSIRFNILFKVYEKYIRKQS